MYDLLKLVATLSFHSLTKYGSLPCGYENHMGKVLYCIVLYCVVLMGWSLLP